MALGTLIVMDPRRRFAAITDLRQHDVELSEASDRRTARQILCSGLRFELVITEATLPDGTWCDILRDLRAASVNARLLVSADRHNELLCGDVVARGGYYAVTPPHEWKPLRQVIGPIRKARTQSATHRSVPGAHGDDGGQPRGAWPATPLVTSSSR